eukprot:gene16732-19887_t
MVTSDVLHSDIGLFLVQCLLIIILSRCVSWLFAKIQQPSVIAEIISGILLGPTAFGKIPGFTSHLFPDGSVSLRILNVFAQIGLIFFMFIIGLELDPTLFRSQIRQSVIISASSIILPFGLGVAASLYLADIQGTEWTYSLGIFIGVALSITAFPVLARILTSKKLLSTPIGILSIACAAINDICGWVLLGLSVSLAGSNSSLDSLWTLLAAAGFVAGMLILVKPILDKAVGYVWHVDPQAVTNGHPPSPSHLIMSLVVVLLFISSWLTEIIGIHAMFGAFTLGAITPKIGGFNQAITEKIEDLVLVFLLPLYFVVSGLRTDLTTLDTGKPWLGVLVIILCAVIGKILGAGVTARFLGHSNRDSLSIGVLMNTRGLVELIVLNLGLDFGIIKTQVFGIMVLMAVFTTLMTSPLIALLIKKDKRASATDEFTVVLCTPTLNIGPSLVDLGYTISNKISVSTIRRKKMRKIYLLSISEVNDRPSDFIGQIRKDISKQHYSHLVAQGAAMKVKVSYHSICTDNDHLSKEVIQFTKNKAASLLIIGEDNGNLIQGRGGMISGDIQWSLIKNSVSHVGVFTDKSGVRGSVHRFKRILLAYLGGKNPNDDESLNLVNRMAETDEVTVTIIVFDNESYWKHKRRMIELKNNANKAENIPEAPSMVDGIVADNPLKKSNLGVSPPSGGVDALNVEPAAPSFLQAPSVQASLGATGLSGSSSSLGKTTEFYDPEKMIQHESHLEAVLNGKNAHKINVIYKPKKQRQKTLLEECVSYDLMVVPFETKKVVAPNSPFTGFHMPGIDAMKRSLSMVHLPGHSRKLSESQSTHHHDLESGNYPMGNSGKVNLEMMEDTSAHTSDENGLNVSTEIENPSQLHESSEEPFWHRCPVSTLVIYHVDSIPPPPESTDDVKEVDPSNEHQTFHDDVPMDNYPEHNHSE